MIGTKKLVVKMGNNTQSQKVHEEEVIPIRWINDNILYAIARNGIACVNVLQNGGYSCTHLMPWNYAEWIQFNWNIEVTPKMQETASVLRKF